MSHEYSEWRAPITGLVTLPPSEALSGTITSDGKIVTGSGTSVLADFEPGEWVYDASQKEVREVLSISERLEVLYIDRPFSVDIAAPIALVKVPHSELEELSLLIDVGLNDGEIDGNPFPAGTPVTFKKETPARGRKGFISPKVIDGTATTIRVLTIK